VYFCGIAEEGLHRVNWNLRHGDPDQPDTWERFDDPDYTRNPRQTGDFTVSPGIYTVTLKARGTESSQTVGVKGDPLLHLTDADYRATEDYLLRLRDVNQRAREAVDAAPEEIAEAIGTLLRDLRALGRRVGDAGRFNDGNFGPPTASDRERLAEIEVRLARLTGG
jgi:hypothetical protein